MKQTKPKQIRGFAAMHPDTKHRICTMGGLTVSKNKLHMAAIGALGGLRSQANRRAARKAQVRVNRKNV